MTDVTMPLERVNEIVDHLLGDGTRDGLILGNALNMAMGASARRLANPPAHRCGLCDQPIRFQGVVDGHRTWECVACGWWHTGQDCCDPFRPETLTPYQVTAIRNFIEEEWDGKDVSLDRLLDVAREAWQPLPVEQEGRES